MGSRYKQEPSEYSDEVESSDQSGSVSREDSPRGVKKSVATNDSMSKFSNDSAESSVYSDVKQSMGVKTKAIKPEKENFFDKFKKLKAKIKSLRAKNDSKSSSKLSANQSTVDDQNCDEQDDNRAGLN